MRRCTTDETNIPEKSKFLTTIAGNKKDFNIELTNCYISIVIYQLLQEVDNYEPPQ